MKRVPTTLATNGQAAARPEYGFRETFLAHFAAPEEADALRCTGDVLMNYLCETHQYGGDGETPLWPRLLPAAAKDLRDVASELNELAGDFTRGGAELPSDPQMRRDLARLLGFAARAEELADEIAATFEEWLREDAEAEDEALSQPAAEATQQAGGSP